FFPLSQALRRFGDGVFAEARRGRPSGAGRERPNRTRPRPRRRRRAGRECSDAGARVSHVITLVRELCVLSKGALPGTSTPLARWSGRKRIRPFLSPFFPHENEQACHPERARGTRA